MRSQAGPRSAMPVPPPTLQGPASPESIFAGFSASTQTKHPKWGSVLRRGDHKSQMFHCAHTTASTLQVPLAPVADTRADTTFPVDYLQAQSA